MWGSAPGPRQSGPSTDSSSDFNLVERQCASLTRLLQLRQEVRGNTAQRYCLSRSCEAYDTWVSTQLLRLLLHYKLRFFSKTNLTVMADANKGTLGIVAAVKAEAARNQQRARFERLRLYGPLPWVFPSRLRLY